MKNIVNYTPINKKDYYNYVACVLEVLTKKYNFFFCDCLVSNFKNSINDCLINKHEKNKHKIIMYYDPVVKAVYFAIYKKENVQVYTCKISYPTAKKYLNNLNRLYKYFIKERNNEDYGN